MRTLPEAIRRVREGRREEEREEGCRVGGGVHIVKYITNWQKFQAVSIFTRGAHSLPCMIFKTVFISDYANKQEIRESGMDFLYLNGLMFVTTRNVN